MHSSAVPSVGRCDYRYTSARWDHFTRTILNLPTHILQNKPQNVAVLCLYLHTKRYLPFNAAFIVYFSLSNSHIKLIALK